MLLRRDVQGCNTVMSIVIMDMYPTNITENVPADSVFHTINIIYSINMICGLGANFITILTILKTKYLRTPMNIGLVSLAVADIVVSGVLIPARMFLYNMTTGEQNLALCKADTMIKGVCDYAQPCMLVVTSFERYKSIAKPLESKGNRRRVAVFVTGTWCVCLVIGVISVVGFHDAATHYPCHILKVNNLDDLYTSVFREGILTFPFGLFCILCVVSLYVVMIKVLHQHTKAMSKRSRKFKNKIKPSSVKQKPTTRTIGITSKSPDDGTLYTHPTVSTCIHSDSQHSSVVHSAIQNTHPHGNSVASEISECPTIRKLSIRQTRNVLCPSESRRTLKAAAKQIIVKSSRTEAFGISFTELNRSSNTQLLSCHGNTYNKDTDASSSKITPENTVQPISLAMIGNEYLSSEPHLNWQISQRKNSSLNTINKNVNTMNSLANSRLVDPNPDNNEIGQNQFTPEEKTNTKTYIITTEEIHSSHVSVPNMKQPGCMSIRKSSISASKKALDGQDDDSPPMIFNMSLKVEDESDLCNHDNVTLSCKNSIFENVLSANGDRSMCKSHANHIDLSDEVQCTDARNNILSEKTDKTDKTESTQSQSVETPESKQPNGRVDLPDNPECMPENENKSGNDKAEVVMVLSATPDKKPTGEAPLSSDNQHGDHVTHLTKCETNNLTKLGSAGDIDKKSPNDTANKSVSVDVVDFDGTVHKEVLVEGTVVGAVCVMNTSNRVAGRRKVEMRAAKRIAVLIGSFVCVWLPLPVTALFMSNKPDLTSSDVAVMLVTGAISALTVSVNPVLNLILNRQLRSAAYTVIKRLFTKCSLR